VLIVQHGIGLGTFKTVDLLGNETFAVWGPCFKRSLQKLGVKNVEVVGNLAFDGFDARGGGEKHILVTTSCYVEDNFISKKEYFNVMKKIFDDLGRVGGLPVIVKLHPREKFISEYKKIADGFTVIQTTTREDYKKLLSESALIITFGSTITVEAIALGKKTILIDPFTSASPLELLVPHIGSTPYVRWDGDVLGAVQKLLAAKRTHSKDREDLLYKLDGKAHERIVKVIGKLIHSSTSSALR
jgi:UDP-N-acetylglucosamine 2-epimerase